MTYPGHFHPGSKPGKRRAGQPSWFAPLNRVGIARLESCQPGRMYGYRLPDSRLSRREWTGAGIASVLQVQFSPAPRVVAPHGTRCVRQILLG